MTITDDDIRALRDESAAAGDYTMARICDVAIYGPEGVAAPEDTDDLVARVPVEWTQEEARDECVLVISYERANAPGAEQWTAAEVAAHLGVTAATWRTYVHRGEAPRPDGYLGRTPWWRPATVAAWDAARPGQGVGGGRPRAVRA